MNMDYIELSKDYMAGFESGTAEPLTHPIAFLDIFSDKKAYRDLVDREIKIKNTAADRFVVGRRKVENREAFQAGYTTAVYTAYVLGGASVGLANIWFRDKRRKIRGEIARNEYMPQGGLEEE